ncbi:DNA-binding transcriptional regulator, LacI/PurR family [Pedobacter steynii]|uniref:DNA-binding transcriptional regulator, LacI/PurR family n=1 Tax=Pedobacter steynii TaxID=430522 RepID=A0A1H0G0R9_9SPHI|nr:substrate-binding domain-containing protein [Pedobacter steynii]NQX42285.1 substrate-binding domain-containing protein [Pedobacter steynii]SDO00497.1 DNA-binding transcriptional regulator, LacI/PurR family [Pedobacter steynii]
MQCIYENLMFPPDQSFTIQSEILEDKPCNVLKSHKYFEIVLLENYCGRYFIGDHILDFEGTQLILLGSYLPHCWQYDKKLDPTAQSQSILVHFLPDFLGQQLLDSPEAIQLNKLFSNASKGISFSGITIPKAKKVMQEMLLSEGMARTALMLKLLDILAQSETKQALSSSYFNVVDNAHEGQKISKVYDYVFRNFSNHVSLPVVADILSMTPASFCRFFKMKTGRTLVDFIKEVRIGHATKLLLEDNYNISETSFLCGYNNYSNFNKQFKELTGLSPVIFQKQYRLKYKASSTQSRSNIPLSVRKKVLNDAPEIKASTRSVLRDMTASFQHDRTNIIGILVPTLDRSFFNSVVQGIETVLNKNDYSVLLYQSKESFDNEVLGVKTLIKSGVDGIISSIALQTSNYDHFTDLKKRNIPLLLFDRIVKEVCVPSVRIDDYRGGFSATEHLIKQGCKHIVHLSTDQDVPIFKERLRGYRDALSQYNLPVNEALIFYGSPSLDFGNQCIQNLIENNILFDGVFAFEDYTGLGVLKKLKEYKIKVPDQVKVIGFANETFGAHVATALSTIDQQTVKMGEVVAQLFLKLIKEEHYYRNIPEEIILDTILIARDSSQ